MKTSTKLQQLESSNDDAMFVFLSDVWLDDMKVTDYDVPHSIVTFMQYVMKVTAELTYLCSGSKRLKVPTFIYHHLPGNQNSSGLQCKVAY